MTKDALIINPADYAKRLTTTLKRLKEAGACLGRYRHLLRGMGEANGWKPLDHEAPLNLLEILHFNGPEDCIWALRAAAEPCDILARLMATDFAVLALPIFEKERPVDMRPRNAIWASRSFALGGLAPFHVVELGKEARVASREVVLEMLGEGVSLAVKANDPEAVWEYSKASTNCPASYAARAAANAADPMDDILQGAADTLWYVRKLGFDVSILAIIRSYLLP